MEPLLVDLRKRCIAAEAELFRLQEECCRLRQSALEAQPALQEGTRAKVGLFLFGRYQSVITAIAVTITERHTPVPLQRAKV